MTFLVMSIPFLAIAALVWGIGLRRASTRGAARPFLAAWALATATLLLLTIVFDNLMIAAGPFDYGAEGILGVRLVLMPIEDLLYPIATASLLAGASSLLGAAERERTTRDG